MTAVYEHEGPSAPLKDGQVDGMAEFVESEDDVLSSDWDIGFENPPHEHLKDVDLHGVKDAQGSAEK